MFKRKKQKHKSFSRSLLRNFFFRLKKSIDINRQIIELSSQIGSIQEFCSSVNTFYNLTQFNMRSFNEILSQEVVFKNNTDQESRRFFMRRCIQNPELFQSLYRLK